MTTYDSIDAKVSKNEGPRVPGGRCNANENGSTCRLALHHGPVHVGPRGDGTYGRWTTSSPSSS